MNTRLHPAAVLLGLAAAIVAFGTVAWNLSADPETASAAPWVYRGILATCAVAALLTPAISRVFSRRPQ